MSRSVASTIRTLFLGVVLVLGTIVSLPAVSQAATGSVTLVITKAGLIVGLGGGHGVLTFKGHQYKLKISGLSLGATLGISSTKLVGKAKNMQSPEDIAGSYRTVEGGGALVGGAGAVRLKNSKGVLLELGGPKVGLELSVAAGGIKINLD